MWRSSGRGKLWAKVFEHASGPALTYLFIAGGLGRSGLVAARLLIELGAKPEDAIGQVRRARPSAIETTKQEEYVRATKPAPEKAPSGSAEAVKDRAIGALLGLAIGDAVGTTLEFKARDSYQPISDMVGGGPFDLKPGEWTDDTAMALALADSLMGKDDLDEQDLMRHFVDWRDGGRLRSRDVVGVQRPVAGASFTATLPRLRSENS